MVDDNELNAMIKLLEAMTPKFHAPTDGKGKYLGDGIPRDGMTRLRTGVLLDALCELQEQRMKESSHEQ